VLHSFATGIDGVSQMMVHIHRVHLVLLLKLLTHVYHAGVRSLHAQRTLLHGHPKWLISLHGVIDLAFGVLAHQQADRRQQYAVNQVKAAFERGEELDRPGTCDDKLIHRDTIEE